MDSSNASANEQQHQEHQPEERRLFTSKAHVFEIDPVTKRSWSPKSDEAVPVSLVIDLRQKVLSLIGTDPKQQETIINSIILPRTIFTRTSQKFGQWSDSVANTVYGLGFATENELNKFVTKFQESKKLLPTITTTVMPSSSSSSLNYQQPHLGSSASSSSWANNNSAQQHQQQQHAYNASQSSADLNQVCNDLASAQLGTHNNTNNQQNIQSQTLANNDPHMTANVSQLNKNNNITNNSNNIAIDSNGNNSSLISDTGPDIANNSVGSHHRSHSMSGIRARMNSSSPTKSEQQLQQHEQHHSNTLGHSVKHQSSSHTTGRSITKSTNNNNNDSPLSTRESLLQYENDRLKIALADVNIDFNANMKKWQLEVQKLKTNIYKLTGALQESNNNRSEWEQLLNKLRNENAKYQIRILELEAANGDQEARAGLQEKFDRIRHELEKSQTELKNKECEISVLREDLEELRKEKNSYKANNNMDSQDMNRQFEVVYTKIGSKVRELDEIHQEFGLLLESK